MLTVFCFLIKDEFYYFIFCKINVFIENKAKYQIFRSQYKFLVILNNPLLIQGISYAMQTLIVILLPYLLYSPFFIFSILK